MQRLTMIEAFSGIGAQKRGIDNTKLFDLEVIGTSEIDKDAILSYAVVHHNLNQEMVDSYQYPSREDMVVYLKEKNIGYDFKKSQPFKWEKYLKTKNKDLNKYWLACQLQNNFGDISLIKTLPYTDVLTFSYPCTDISGAGKQKGMAEGETRSGLIWEVIRILKQMKVDGNLPKYLLLENVKALVSKKFIDDFNAINEIISEIGYNVYWEVLNAKDYNIPQNRERVFGVYIRKDIDSGKFSFPKQMELQYRLKDLLEKEVDEKFYITDGILDSLVQKGLNSVEAGIVGNPRSREYHGFKDVSPTLCARDYKDPKCVQLGSLTGDKWDKMHESSKRVYDENGLAPTVHTCGGGNIEPKIMQSIENEVMLLDDTKSERFGGGKIWKDISPCLRHSRHGHKIISKETILSEQLPLDEQNKKLRLDGTVGTLMTDGSSPKHNNRIVETNLKIRKLIPLECWRLMGFTDLDVQKCYNMKLSNSALYKQAGNSIVTNCIQYIFECLYEAQYLVYEENK